MIRIVDSEFNAWQCFVCDEDLFMTLRVLPTVIPGKKNVGRRLNILNAIDELAIRRATGDINA